MKNAGPKREVEQDHDCDLVERPAPYHPPEERQPEPECIRCGGVHVPLLLGEELAGDVVEWNPRVGQLVELKDSPGETVPASDDDVWAVKSEKNLAGRKKAQIQLFPVSAVIEAADAMAEGAEKYGPFNWRKGKIELMQYLRAILAHTYAIIDGEDWDPESANDKRHIAGILASAAIIVDADSVGMVIDDRPPKGKAAEMLRERAK